MGKKLAALALSLCLVLAAVPALAAGELVVNQETYVPVKNGSSVYGYIFAEVTNTGDAPVELKDGTFEVLDADGTVVKNVNVYQTYPKVIAPGEVAYIYEHISVSGVEGPEAIPGYKLTLNSQDSNKEGFPRLPATAVVNEVPYWFDTAYRVDATITNGTAEVVYEPYVSYGLYDAAGKLLYSKRETLYGLGVPSGNSLIVLSIADELMEAWTAENIVPAEIKVIGYYE